MITGDGRWERGAVLPVLFCCCLSACPALLPQLLASGPSRPHGRTNSTEALCFPTENGTPDAVCITLYADEDGYELCVADRTASTERCVSNYRFGDPDGSEDDGPEEDRWSVVNL